MERPTRSSDGISGLHLRDPSNLSHQLASVATNTRFIGLVVFSCFILLGTAASTAAALHSMIRLLLPSTVTEGAKAPRVADRTTEGFTPDDPEARTDEGTAWRVPEAWPAAEVLRLSIILMM